MSELIQQIIIMVAPYIMTILTFIGVIVKVMHSFKSLKNEVRDNKKLEAQIQKVLEENYELKKKLNETMTLIDRVERRD